MAKGDVDTYYDDGAWRTGSRARSPSRPSATPRLPGASWRRPSASSTSFATRTARLASGTPIPGRGILGRLRADRPTVPTEAPTTCGKGRTLPTNLTPPLPPAPSRRGHRSAPSGRVSRGRTDRSPALLRIGSPDDQLGVRCVRSPSPVGKSPTPETAPTERCAPHHRPPVPPAPQRHRLQLRRRLRQGPPRLVQQPGRQPPGAVYLESRQKSVLLPVDAAALTPGSCLAVAPRTE